MARPFVTGVLTAAALEAAFADVDSRIDAEAALAKQFSQDVDSTSGLSFATFAGYWNGAAVDAASTLLTTASTNYVELDTTGDDPAIAANTTGWSGSGFVPLFVVVAGALSIVSVVDARGWAGGEGAAALVLAAGDGIAISGSGTKTIAISDSGVTDAKLGDRTIDDTAAPSVDADDLTAQLSGLANRIVAITGEAGWKADPDSTLAVASTHIASAAPHSGHLAVDGSNVPAADQPMGGFKLANLGDGTEATDAVNKGQLDAVAGGNRDLLAVKVASVANLAALSGLLTIETVTLLAGDRVLVKNQTTASENGIYEAAAGAWARAADLDSGDTPDPGLRVFVEFGTTQTGTSWTMVTASVTVGTDAMVWTKSGAGGGGEANTASNAGSGAGLLFKGKSGVDLAFKSLLAGSTKLAVTNNSDDVTVDVVPGNIAIGDLSGTLGVAKGGTGKAAVTAGALLAGNGTAALSEIAAPANDGVQRSLLGTQLAGATTLAWGLAGVVGVVGTSSTSLAIGLGSKTLTTQAGLGWAVGSRLRIASTTAPATQYMEGVVNGYSGTSLTVLVDNKLGSGTVASWSIVPAGDTGTVSGFTGATTFLRNPNTIPDFAPGAGGGTDYNLSDGFRIAFTNDYDGTAAGNDALVIDKVDEDVTNPESKLALRLQTRDDVTLTSVVLGKNGVDVMPVLRLLDTTEPGTTTSKLYAVSGALKWAGKLVAMIATTLGNSQTVETDSSGNLVTAAKGTAYNKNFGTASGDVAAGDALALKAPLASPALTGVPTVPTATAGTNTTQAASTAFVTAAVAAGGGGGGGGSLDSRDVWLF